MRVDLGRFNPDLAGRAIYGRVADDQFVPYHSRAEIENGALADRHVELLWVDDPIDKFFLQIQGSGQVRLDDGSVVRVGYASQNGHPYRAIGRDLIEIGALSRDEVSLQTIRAWLQSHPEDAAALTALGLHALHSTVLPPTPITTNASPTTSSSAFKHFICFI